MPLSQTDLINSGLSNLVLELNKKFAKTHPTLYVRLKNKLESIFRIFVDLDKPVTKEMTFLILWSILNEFSGKFVTKPKGEYPKKEESLLNLISIKHKFKDYKYLPFYRQIRYFLKPSQLTCYTIIEDDTHNAKLDLLKMSFYIKVFLKNEYGNEELLLLFDYLCRLRNKLFLIHGNEDGEQFIIGSAKLDNVTIEDCNWMIIFLHKLFNLPTRNSITSRIFENTTPARNKIWYASGTLLDKFANTFESSEFYFVVELFDSSGPITRKVSVSEKIFYAYEIGSSFLDGGNQTIIKDKSKPIAKTYYKITLGSSAKEKSCSSIFTVSSEDYEKLNINDFVRIEFHFENNHMLNNLIAHSVRVLSSKPESGNVHKIDCKIIDKFDASGRNLYKMKILTKKNDLKQSYNWKIVSQEEYSKYELRDSYIDPNQEIVDKIIEIAEVHSYSFMVEYQNSFTTKSAIVKVKSKSDFESCSIGDTISAEVHLDATEKVNIITLQRFTKLVRGPLLNSSSDNLN